MGKNKINGGGSWFWGSPPTNEQSTSTSLPLAQEPAETEKKPFFSNFSWLFTKSEQPSQTPQTPQTPQTGGKKRKSKKVKKTKKTKTNKSRK